MKKYLFLSILSFWIGVSCFGLAPSFGSETAKFLVSQGFFFSILGFIGVFYIISV